MADKTLLFNTDAGKEVNTLQTLVPRLDQSEALGGKTVTETPVRVLARDKDGNLVASPILTDILNTEFVNVVRRDWDGKDEDGLWVTFATTSNDENGGVDPERSLLVSLKDLIITLGVPSDVSEVTSEPITREADNPGDDPIPVDVPCRWYGKPITLDKIDALNDIDIPKDNWDLIANRSIRLHKNNGQSVSGKWSLDLDRIAKRTPDVLFLEVGDEESLVIHLDPSVKQTIPVIFTPDDGQDEFKLLLFVRVFDEREAQKQLKISNSTTTPAEAQFLNPWVILEDVDDEHLTGANGEGGALKCEGLTNCVKALDAETGEAIADEDVTVTVVPKVAAFSTDGTLDAVKIPSVPKEHAESQLENLVENGLFTVEATVSSFGYETKTVNLAVCIDGEDERDPHLSIIVDNEALNLERVLQNPSSEPDVAGVAYCTSRHNESDEVEDNTLAISSGISGKDGDADKTVTPTIVDKNGAAAKVIYVVSGESGEPSGYVLVKCECSGYVTETIKVPVKLTDERNPDGKARWTVTWTTEPSVTLLATEKSKKNEKAEVIVSSQGLEGVSTAIAKANKLTDQWGNEETAVATVVGLVDEQHPLSKSTVDLVDIPANAGDVTDDAGTPDDDADDTTTPGAGCWINISVLTESGLVINKKVKASVTDNRAE